jgi:hypothetical protein
MEILEYKICGNVGELRKVLENLPDDMLFMGNLSDFLKVVILDYRKDDIKGNELFSKKTDLQKEIRKKLKEKNYRFLSIKEANVDDLQLFENL